MDQSRRQRRTFHVSDDAFMCFKQIELCTRDRLTSLLRSTTDDASRKELLIEHTASESIVLRYWNILASDLDADQSVQLLKECITQWLIIRGYSIAGYWTELHTSASKGSSSQSLRKSLQRTN